MAEARQDVSIKGESVQRVYSFYHEGRFIINRRYQRKLVWSVEEKQKFVDSISKTYPVPLFLLANVYYNGRDKYEVIDGMQRLNAINSFIEQEFGIVSGEDEKEYFFDLTTMPDTNNLKDEEILVQRTPKLDRVTCARIANYPLPLSVYTIDSTNEIDEIFRRINSGGRQLSHQEVRQSSSLGYFADAVRRIASKLRGDDSAREILLLNDMNKISVSNRKLAHYGIIVDEIFWVKQSILSREKVRQSNDEEIVADILGSMLLPDKYTSNKDILDNLYGIYAEDSQAKVDRHTLLENTLNKDQEYWIEVFINIYDEIRQVVAQSGENLNSLINRNADTSRFATKHFFTIFLALYELIVPERKSISDYKLLAEKLKDSRKAISISGGYYSGKVKRTNIDAVKGIISPAFRDRTIDGDNPAFDRWFTKLENILVSSYTEQALYEFKQGFHKLDVNGNFDDNVIEKVVKTLTAMANMGKGVKGYIIVGIADDKAASETICNYYSNLNNEPRIYNKFYITGINSEVETHYGGDYDKYLMKIQAKIKATALDSGFLQNNIKVRQINYYEKALIIIEVASSDKPIDYGEKYYIRTSNGNGEVKPKDFGLLWEKFSS